MAYKRNPMRCERIASLARFVVSLEPNANLTHGVQFFERTLDDSANRRLVIPESFLATDAILVLMENIASGLEVHPARIRRRLADEMPFMATEELIVRAVRAGGDRQVAHERIRQHSIEAARALKDGAERNDLLERLAADASFGVPLAELAKRSNRSRFIGRAPQQVDEFLDRRRRAVARRPRAARLDADRRGRARGSPRMTIANLAPLPLPHLRRGKVREVYIVDDARLLLVATDRVSAFDVVMREPIPHKGAVLTQLTAWWLRKFDDVVRHHMLSADIDEIVDAVPALIDHRASLDGRAMLCRRTTVFPVECVVRGYLSGSAWKEYAATTTLAGESLPPGMRESERLDPPLFSPATKAEAGHDENITIARMSTMVGPHIAYELERLSRLVYTRGRTIAAERGIIIADTKFEFGRDREGHITLIDEVLTPDSSRFWPAEHYQPGRGQPSFDKQPLRDYLDAERRAGRWNGDAPPPHIAARGRRRYQRALSRRLPPNHRRRPRRWK